MHTASEAFQHLGHCGAEEDIPEGVSNGVFQNLDPKFEDASANKFFFKELANHQGHREASLQMHTLLGGFRPNTQ